MPESKSDKQMAFEFQNVIKLMSNNIYPGEQILKEP